MDLIERYLNSIRFFLPRAQRDDILAELRDVLITRREERQAELGRPLTAKEDEALLQAFGHPLAVAARYGRQQYLIGPELYPIYAFVVKIVLASVGVAALVTGVVATAMADGYLGNGIGKAMSVLWTGGLASVGAVTIVFAVMQRTGAGKRIVSDWSARDLPKLTPRPRRKRRQPSWPEHVAGIVVQTLFILWWVGLIQLWPPIIPLDTGGLLTLAFAPALNGLYLPVLAVAAGAIVVHAVKLGGPETRALGYGAEIVLQGALLALAGFALHAGRWVAVSGVGVPAVTLANAAIGVNIGAEVTLIVILCTAVGHLAVAGWRLAMLARAARPATNGA